MIQSRLCMFGSSSFVVELTETIILMILVIILFTGLVMSLLSLANFVKNRKLAAAKSAPLPPVPELVVVVDTSKLSRSC